MKTFRLPSLSDSCPHRGASEHPRDLRADQDLPGGRRAGVVVVFRDIQELRELTEEAKGRARFEGLIGKNHRMRQIYRLIEQVADSTASVLIEGESGTGKELVAKAIHRRSPRANNPFVAVSCAALAESLLESELFGHVKGAFTGAVTAKVGRFELANGGTLFLDEIGDISPAIQLKLLRVLQEHTFERVGESRPRAVDVRIIAATNRDLRRLIAEGKFREDRTTGSRWLRSPSRRSASGRTTSRSSRHTSSNGFGRRLANRSRASRRMP